MTVKTMMAEKRLDTRQASWAKGSHFRPGTVVELFISRSPFVHLRLVGENFTYFEGMDGEVYRSTCLAPCDITDDRYRVWNGPHPFDGVNPL